MTDSNKTPSKLGNIALWVLSVLLGLAFLGAGGTKLAGLPPHPENFTQHWGYPLWFMYVTGAIEVAAAVMLFIPKTQGAGATLLVATMAGAVLTHLTHNEAGMVVAPFVLLLQAAIVAWFRRGQTLALIGRGASPTAA